MTLAVEENSAATTVDDTVPPPIEDLAPAEIPAAVGKDEVKIKKRLRSRARRQGKKAAVQVPSTSEGGTGETVPVVVAAKKEKKRTRPFPQPRRQSSFFVERQRNSRKLWFVRSGVPKLTLEQMDELTTEVGALTLEEDNVCEGFEDMGLKPEVLQGIYNNGLEKPAYIQKRAIVLGREGKDIIVQAQSGMGKTAALVITILQRIDPKDQKCQALILCPTRELAEQVAKIFEELSNFFEPKLAIYCCAGGSDRVKCKEALESGQQIVIGTVGRTLDMIVGDRTGPHISLKSLKVFALDEADQMLEGNFGRDLTSIVKWLPPPSKTQVILMSATMPEKILKIAHRFMLNPVKILVQNDQLTLDGIRQFFVKVNNTADKASTLADLYRLIEKARGMIFCNCRNTVNEVVKRMNELECPLQCITGDMSQAKRDEIMDKLRRGEEGFRVIITSDLLGRGIDIQQINLVINWDIPTSKEAYIHRVGRAGRYGRKGVALTFVNEDEDKEFRMLEEFYQTEIDAMPARDDFQALLTESFA